MSCQDNVLIYKADTLCPQHHQAVFKFKKNIQKCINVNNKKEIKEKAQTFEAKPFNTLNSEAGPRRQCRALCGCCLQS